MAARAFARVAPFRAKVSLAAVVVLAIAAGRASSATCRFAKGRGSRARRSRSTTSRWSRSPSAARSSTATAACSCARCRRSRSSRCRPTSSSRTAPPSKLAPLLRKPAADLEAALRDRSQFRWLARKVPHEVAAARARAQLRRRRHAKAKRPACGSSRRAGSRRR